mgnify:CR=1 FL=1
MYQATLEDTRAVLEDKIATKKAGMRGWERESKSWITGGAVREALKKDQEVLKMLENVKDMVEKNEKSNDSLTNKLEHLKSIRSQIRLPEVPQAVMVEMLGKTPEEAAQAGLDAYQRGDKRFGVDYTLNKQLDGVISTLDTLEKGTCGCQPPTRQERRTV